jgi:hypothetical protein
MHEKYVYISLHTEQRTELNNGFNNDSYTSNNYTNDSYCRCDGCTCSRPSADSAKNLMLKGLEMLASRKLSLYVRFSTL